MTTLADLVKYTARVDAVEVREGGNGFSADEARAWTARGPVRFGTERLGSTYWSRQVDILNAAWANPRVAVRSANAMGKNFVAADFEAWWISAKGGTVIHMANADRQLDIATKELRRAYHGAGLPYELFHRSLRVQGETRFIAMTSNSADSLRGFHDPLGLLVVIDEGQGASVEAVAYDAAFSCATGEGDKILVAGNPAHPTGRFFAISHAANWFSLKIAASEHPNISGVGPRIEGGPAPDWPATIAAEYGRESPFYKAFVEGEFPSESIESVFTRLSFERAFAKYESPSDLSVQAMRQPCVLSWDVSLRGSDSNAVAVCQGHYVREFIEWHASDINTSYAKIEALSASMPDRWSTAWDREERRQRGYDHPSRAHLVIDGAGLGAPAIDAMRARGFTVTDYIGARSARDDQHYANVRAESYFMFRLALEKGEIALPRSEKMVEEALATEWFVNGTDRIQLIAKDDIRASLGRSPDLLDSCVAGMYYTLLQALAGKWGTSKHSFFKTRGT